jgi:hypothetical protein
VARSEQPLVRARRLERPLYFSSSFGLHDLDELIITGTAKRVPARGCPTTGRKGCGWRAEAAFRLSYG